MSFSKKFKHKSPIKKDDDGNPVIDFLKKGVKSIVAGPIPTLTEQGGKFIKNQIAKNINPRNYGEYPLERVGKAVVGIPEEGSVNKIDKRSISEIEEYRNATKERQDLFNLMMTGETPNNAVQVSKYKPTKSEDPEAIYYSSPSTENFIKKQIEEGRDDSSKWGYSVGNVLGNYTVDKSIDKDGREYFSYYDVWDLNPFQGEGVKDKLATKAQEVIGVKPAEVYGRVYVDEVIEEPWQKKMENRNNKE
jgi:hypothetical protein